MIPHFDTPTKSEQIKFSLEEEQFLVSEIKTLLLKGVIIECFHEEGEFISPIFLAPKPDSSYRMILNLKKAKYLYAILAF